MDPSLMAAIDNNQRLPDHQDPEEDRDSFGELEPFHSDEGEEMDVDDPPRGISRNYPELIDDDDDEDQYGRKKPLSRFIDLVDEDPEEPNLEEYFSQWDMPWKQQVLICRSYASYLSSRNRQRTAPTPRAQARSAGSKRARSDKNAGGITSMRMKK